MIKTLFLSTIILALGSFPNFRSSTGKDEQENILGIWITPEQDGKIEIHKEGDRYFGTLISYKNPDATDIYNPDPDLRDRSVIGMQILQNFLYDEEENEWIEGTIYDPKTGKTYGGNLWIDKKDPTQLKAHGFVMGMSFLGRTETFTRSEE